MTQVLPYIPSFLEQLSPHISQTAGAIGTGIGQHYRNKADASILQQLQSGTVKPVDYPTLWSKLSPAARKTNEPFLASHLRTQEAAAKEEQKRETKDLEKYESAKSVIDTADEMEKLIEYTGSTRIPFTKSAGARPEAFFNREGVEKRNEFDTLAASAASFFRDLETKGQLPLGLYEKVILPRLPNSEVSERENKGRIKGIVALAKKYGGKKFNESAKASKVEKGTKITKNVLDQWKKDGLTRDQAEERAKEQGYEF